MVSALQNLQRYYTYYIRWCLWKMFVKHKLVLLLILFVPPSHHHCKSLIKWTEIAHNCLATFVLLILDFAIVKWYSKSRIGAVKCDIIKVLTHYHQNLLRSYHVPTAMLSALYIKLHLMFKKVLQYKY